MNRLPSMATGAVLAAASFFGPAAAAEQAAPPQNQRPIVVHRLHGTPANAPIGGSGTTGNGISYNGGPLILGGTNIYYIWYGNWSTDAGANTILTNFGNSIGGSPYFNINTTYFDGTNTNVTNKVTLAGSVTSTYVAANPTNLNDNDIWGIVTTAFSKGLPQDPNGVYFVLTAPGVGESTGFLSTYCGWHTAATYNGGWIKYSFVGDANGVYACTGQINGPNGDVGADAMASVIAHELEESTTDPLINAWYSGNYQENADKCAWTFGATYTAANGATANMNLGGHDYMIQQNWVNAQGGVCALSYSTEPDYNLTLTTSSSVSVAAGNTATYGLGINAVNGFSSALSLSVSGLPAGATPSFAPNPMTTSSTLSVSTTSSTAAGTYPLTITSSGGTASGGGPIVRTIAASLTVTAPATPDFTLSVSPTSQTVIQGNPTLAYQVTVNPLNGFTGTVTLSVKTTLPTGAGWSSTSGTPGTKGTVTLTTSASTPTGSYPFTIQGVSGGLTRTVGATLVVNSAGSFSISVSPNPLVVKRGSSNTYTVTVAPKNGFNSSVTLTISGLPSKTTASTFTPNTVPGSGGTAQVTITAASTARATKKPVTITVTGKGGNLSFFGTAGLTIQ